MGHKAPIWSALVFPYSATQGLAIPPLMKQVSKLVCVTHRYSVPRNDMMKRKKEAAKVAKATSEPPSRRSQISEGETTVRSFSQSQLGSILEELDDEAALEAGIDHPFCPQNDSESGRGMSKSRNTLSWWFGQNEWHALRKVCHSEFPVGFPAWSFVLWVRVPPFCPPLSVLRSWVVRICLKFHMEGLHIPSLHAVDCCRAAHMFLKRLAWRS